MSSLVFPPDSTKACLAWNNTKRPVFSTIIHQAASGKESRMAQRAFPRWVWTWEYKVLKSSVELNDVLHDVVGFFLKHRGSYESFLIEDTEDNHVTLQRLGIVTHDAQKFQLIRSYGGFIEPVYDYKPPVVIKVDTSNQQQVDPPPALGTVSVSPTGLVSFSNNNLVAQGIQAVYATFSYYHRVRFLEDEMEVEEFMENLWSLNSVSMISDLR